jgi:hypothetical protein
VRKKKITVGLSEQDIDRAIREMAQYKTEFLQKVELLREKVADRLAVEAQSGFTGAVVDDLIKRGQKFADVKVSVDNRANLSVVVANGEDAVWVEFGAGVYHNGSPGSSPHPNGAELGFTIGSFGKGNGKKEAWGYYDENNELKLTRGTPATMPMYRAVQTVCNDIQNIAREVFG